MVKRKKTAGSDRDGTTRTEAGSVGEILRNIVSELKSRDGFRAAQEIARLAVAAPSRWLSLVLREECLPAPESETFDPRFDTCQYAASHLRRLMPSQLAEIDELDAALTTLRLVRQTLQAIRTKLDSLSFNSLSITTRIFKIAAFIESQARIARRVVIAKGARSGQSVGLLEIAHAAVPSAGGSATTNILAGWDATVEGLELALRYSMRTAPGTGSIPTETNESTPYEDPVFHELDRLAQTWRIYQEIWAKARFTRWRARSEEASTILEPTDGEAFLRSEVGKIRQRTVMAEFSASLIRNTGNDSDTPTLMDAVAASITVPPAGHPWNGHLAIEQFCEAARASSYHRMAEAFISFRHYAWHYRHARAVTPAGEISAYDWVRATSVVRVLAAAMARAVEAQVDDVEGHGCIRTVIPVALSRLVELVATASGLTTGVVAAAISALTFAPARRCLELWDQPLLPASPTHVLLAPSLLMSGNPLRALENLIEQWPPSRGSGDGTDLERYLRDQLRMVPGARSECSIQFTTSGGSPVEFDVVFWMQGVVILFECKCQKSVYSAADESRANAEIDYAIDEQLSRRRAVLLSDWTSLRAAAPALDLPPEPPSPDNIFCFAVTTALHRTGEQRNGAHVVDDICLARYLSNPRVQRIEFDRALEVERIDLGQYWPSAEFDVRHFVDYLRSPPQVEVVRRALSVTTDNIPKLSPSEKPVRIAVSSYKPDFELDIRDILTNRPSPQNTKS